MDNRPDLQSLFETMLGSRNVYFQPPESLKLNYPAIVYSLDNLENKHANDSVYNMRDRYLVTYITQNPDDQAIRVLASRPLCRFDRHYKSDNLNHYVYTLYF